MKEIVLMEVFTPLRTGIGSGTGIMVLPLVAMMNIITKNVVGRIGNVVGT